MSDGVSRLPLARHFVWLLREDARRGEPASSPPHAEFEAWWLVRGRAEYPAWSALTPAQEEWLKAPVGALNVDGLTLPLPRAFTLVVKQRADVIQNFTRDGAPDGVALAAWFYALGIHEHKLESIINSDLLRALDQPLADANAGASTAPAATLLMRLVWQLLPPAVRETMNLARTESRLRFIAWFFSHAVGRFQLAPLIASRWRHWLLQEVSQGQTDAEFRSPRFSLLASGLAPVHGQTPEDLRAKALAALAPGNPWAWLKPTSAPPRPTPHATTGARPFGVNLYGFAFGELGIAEDVRMAAAACEAAGIPYRVINVDAGKEVRQSDRALGQQVERSAHAAPYAINIFCLPGFDTVARIFLREGEGPFRDHYNIGWWPWELSVWPDAWGRAFDLLDEVWAGSEFARQMYREATAKPVVLMPLPVCVSRGRKRTRTHFGLPAGVFLFLFVFDFNSHLQRKNPLATVRAFQRAFPADDQGVGLVLKVMNVPVEDPRWQAFLAQCQGDPRIHILTGTLDREDVLGLIECCDACVSLHRAEGFGRTLAEAMLYGKPVVATHYSGNVDFMPQDVSFGVEYELVPVSPGAYHFVEATDQAMWAEPSIEDAATKMQQARASASGRGFGGAIRRYAAAQFSAERIGERMRAQLMQLMQQGYRK